jgi:hypothetical protein
VRSARRPWGIRRVRARTPLAGRTLSQGKRDASLQSASSLADKSHTGSATMTIPQYINEDRSYMRGIKPGWYAADDDGNLFSGPFATHEECVRRIIQATDGSSLRV